MKIPLTPPRLDGLFAGLSSGGFPAVLHGQALVRGHYLHWDQIRHRQPPEDLTPEAWWLGIKLARLGLLKPLPFQDKIGRDFQFGMPDPVLETLHDIDRQAAGHVRMALPVVSGADRDRYLVSSLIEEAVTSSQIEGASTTREVAKAMLRSGRQPADRSEQMIFNNFQAMQAIRELRGQAFTTELVLELHRTLTRDTLDDPSAAGRLRQPDEPIEVVDHRDGVVLHEPPAADQLASRLQRLCQFANGEMPSPGFLHPVVRAIVLHFMLAYDHPFVDGNGRTARALFYWSMANAGYWLMEYISISSLIRQAPGQYARSFLYTETDDNDLTYFILHQLGVIREAIDRLHTYLQRKMDEQQTAERLLRTAPRLADALNHRQVALLSHALRHGAYGYSVASHQRSHQITQQTARTDLLKLAQLDLLAQRKRGRAFVFYAPDDLRQRIESVAVGPNDSSTT